MKSGFENGGRVPVVLPDVPAGGAEEDAVEELMAGPFEIPVVFELTPADEPVIAREVRRRIDEARAEVLRKVLFLVKDAKNPRRLIYQLLYACGMGEACGGSAAAVARKFGVSRQAFEQEGARALASLEIRKNPLEKKQSAAGTYSKTNFRNRKH